MNGRNEYNGAHQVHAKDLILRLNRHGNYQAPDSFWEEVLKDSSFIPLLSYRSDNTPITFDRELNCLSHSEKYIEARPIYPVLILKRGDQYIWSGMKDNYFGSPTKSVFDAKGRAYDFYGQGGLMFIEKDSVMNES